MAELIQMTRENFETMQMVTNYSLIGAVSVIVLLLLILRITPAWPYLKAKFLKRRLLEIFMDDGRKIIKAVTYKNSSAKVKGIGIFTFNPKAVINSSGVQGAMAFESMADPVPPEFVKWSYALIKEGIEDIEMAEGEINETKIKAMLQNLKSHDVDISPDKLKKEGYTKQVQDIAEDMSRVNANESKTHNALIDFYMIQRFFKYDASPTKHEAIVEMEKSDVLLAANKGFRITPDHVIAFIMVAIGSAIAWHMIQSGDMAGAGEAAKSAASAAGSAANAIPSIPAPAP